MTTSIAVLGAGSWGTALALVLARNGHSVYLWSKNAESLKIMYKKRENLYYLKGFSFPDNIKIVFSLQEAVEASDEVLISVPSHAFKEVLLQVKPYLRQAQGIIWVTKGLDTSLRFLHEVVAEKLGACPMALLTGPSFAKEVAEGLPTAVVVAGNQTEYNKQVQNLFQTFYFRVYLSDDLLGAEIGGAVKNILALAVGIAQGLGFHTNTKAAIMTRGLAEMIRLGDALGARGETLTGLAGLGDLILTCSDMQSRNLRFGVLLGQGITITEACNEIGQVVESIATTKLVFELAQKQKVRMPILEQVYAILYENLSPSTAILNLVEHLPFYEN